MRQQILTGFALHQRSYRERSYIVHFLSQEYGRIDGVIRYHAPALYHFVQLHANGKTALKNFSQLDLIGTPFYLQQKALFAGFYLNEVLLRLLPLEEPVPITFKAYLTALEQLKFLSPQDEHDRHLRWILRRFEYFLLSELGYQIDFSSDASGERIDSENDYEFIMNEGFKVKPQGFWRGQTLIELNQQISQPDILFDISRESDLSACHQTVYYLGVLYRDIIDDLLGHKPLKSRQLWQSQSSLIPSTNLSKS